MTENHPHADRLVSVKISTDAWALRHVLRDGPRSGPNAVTLCGRSAATIVDTADYCCQHAWRQRGWTCQVCSDVLGSIHD